MQIEFDTKYRPGRRTFIYILLKHCWLFIALVVGFGYLAFDLYAGSLHMPVTQFLAAHPEWFVDTGMLAEWSALIAVAFFLIGYLRAVMSYRQYTFYLDDHAFHLRRGLFRVQEITIPYAQISNVHIEQPYHWRLFGLAQLDITISSTRDSFKLRRRRDFLIPCIDKGLARDLSRFLVKEASGDDDEEDDDEYDDEDDGEDVSIEDNS
jgi:uncharacterized membrane protein YdbT with pleckstrin-like domain